MAGLFLAAALQAASAAAQPPGRNLTYLALGDSITWGCGSQAAPEGPWSGTFCGADDGGYRVPLCAALDQAGHTVNTMGALRTGPAWAPRNWTLHAGYSGWRIDQVDQVLNASLRTSAVPPNLVTIHLGTNDCGQGAPLPGVRPGLGNITEVMVARMQSLLGHVYQATPQAHVFLASIIGMPSHKEWVNCSKTFNKLLPAMAAQWVSKGMKVVYVPMYEWSEVCVGPLSARRPELKTAALEGLCAAGMVHPTAAGYLRMASAFALSIAETLRVPPPPPPPPPAPPPPAPQPPKGGHWEGPVHTTFGDKDCPNVGCHGGSAAPLTFKECAALCDGLPGCDAMNFSPMSASGAGGCCLRACPAGYGPPREPAGACCAYWRDDNTTRATTIATDGLQ